MPIWSARRGPHVAATATARKLCCLFRCLLTREDYAFARPAMTHFKIRQLELAAGAPPRKGKAGIAGGHKTRSVREAERELAA